MKKLIILMILLLTLTGCASSGELITDHSDLRTTMKTFYTIDSIGENSSNHFDVKVRRLEKATADGTICYFYRIAFAIRRDEKIILNKVDLINQGKVDSLLDKDRFRPESRSMELCFDPTAEDQIYEDYIDNKFSQIYGDNYVIYEDDYIYGDKYAFEATEIIYTVPISEKNLSDKGMTQEQLDDLMKDFSVKIYYNNRKSETIKLHVDNISTDLTVYVIPISERRPVLPNLTADFQNDENWEVPINWPAFK